MELRKLFSKSFVGLLAAGAAGFSSVAAYEIFCPKASLFGRVVTHGSRDVKAVSLLFERAPSESTEALVSCLHKFEVPAVFFIEGCRVKRFPKAFKSLRTFEMGVQAERYRPLIMRKKISLVRLIAPTMYSIEDIQHRRPAFFLPPFGWKEPLLVRTASRLGLITVSPYIRIRKMQQDQAALYAEDISARVSPGDIILLSADAASMGITTEALLDLVYNIVKGVRAKGLAFWGLSPLLMGGA